jgi:hypothetical protein
VAGNRGAALPLSSTPARSGRAASAAWVSSRTGSELAAEFLAEDGGELERWRGGRGSSSLAEASLLSGEEMWRERGGGVEDRDVAPLVLFFYSPCGGCRPRRAAPGERGEQAELRRSARRPSPTETDSPCHRLTVREISPPMTCGAGRGATRPRCGNVEWACPVGPPKRGMWDPRASSSTAAV